MKETANDHFYNLCVVKNSFSPRLRRCMASATYFGSAKNQFPTLQVMYRKERRSLTHQSFILNFGHRMVTLVVAVRLLFDAPSIASIQISYSPAAKAMLTVWAEYRERTIDSASPIFLLHTS